MKRINEFWYCVANQDELPIYRSDLINLESSQNLLKFLKIFKEKYQKNNNIKAIIKNLILDNPSLISDIRLLLGISDKRLYLELTFLANREIASDGRRFVKENRIDLKKHSTQFFINQIKTSEMKEELSRLITDYFCDKGLEKVVHIFSSLEENELLSICDNLINPKEAQQKQAKYRGHGAEKAFAEVFHACGVNIVPADKHIDPMGGYDPNVDLSNMQLVNKDTTNSNIHSFDLVVCDNSGNIKILVQSLIHSSDPGQYGVDKSNETVLIRDLIDTYNERHTDKKVYLLGSVDGVGFSENPNGTIIKMLDKFDDFFQINTLFKIPLFLQKIQLINNVCCINFDSEFFDDDMINYFCEKYLKALDVEMTSEMNHCECKTFGKANIILG